MPLRTGTAARRAVRASAVAVLGLTAWCAPAAAQVITIQPDRGPAVKVPFEEVEGSIGQGVPTPYRIRRPDRPPQTVPVRDAVSVAEVIDEARERGLTDSYSYVSIRRSPPNRGVVRLSEHQITHGSSPPAIYFQGGRLHLIRNSLNSRDYNYEDWVKASSGNLSLRQTREQKLKLELDCPTGSVETGETVTCKARVTGGGLGDDYDFEWDFGEGQLDMHTVRGYSGGPVVRKHTYEQAGAYEVTVAVTTNDGRDDDDEEHELTITQPVQTSPTAPPSAAPLDPPTQTPGPSLPPTTTTPPPPTGSTPRFDFDSPTVTGGDTVAGNLLADISSPQGSSATASAPLGAEAATAASFEPPDSGGTLPPAVWAGLGALMLVTAGAGLESGRRPRLGGLPLRRSGLRLPRLPLRRR